MQLFKQSELKILNRYPLFQYVLISDYLKDFIKENPLNHPYSSLIMRRVKITKPENTTVKDMFSDETIDSAISRSRSSEIDEFMMKECLHLRSITFTLLAYLIYDYQKEAKIFLLQKDDNILMVINDAHNDVLCVIDKYFGSVILYTQDNHLNLINCLNETIRSCAQLSNKLPFDHYYFEFTDTVDFFNNLCMLETLTGHNVPSDFRDLSNYKQSTHYKYFENIQDQYSIMRLINSNYKMGLSEGFITRENNNSQYHVKEVSNFDLMDKKVC